MFIEFLSLSLILAPHSHTRDSLVRVCISAGLGRGWKRIASKRVEFVIFITVECFERKFAVPVENVFFCLPKLLVLLLLLALLAGEKNLF